MSFDAVTTAELPSRQVTTLHLFRHGQVETGGLRLAYGHSDLPLSMQGEDQHAALERFAARLPAPDGVLSSDLRRCMHLAEGLGRVSSLAPRCHPELREQDMGEWEGQAWGALSSRSSQAIHDYWDDYVGARPPGGESLRDLDARVWDWWLGMQDELAGGTWWVAAHIGVIRVLLCRLMGHPLDEALRFAPARGSHTKLLLAEAGAVLEVLGEQPLPVPKAESGPLKIALSGSAGVGKSTLGQALSERLGVPFIPEGMRARLEGGLQLHRLDRGQLRDLIHSLWDEQLEGERRAVRDHGGFVADRGAADFAAFYLHYRFIEAQDGTAAFVSQALAHARGYTRTVVLPWGAIPLRSDGVRSSNPWLQRHFQAVVEGVIHREVQRERVLWLPTERRSLRERVDWVSSWLPAGFALKSRPR